ncbi:zinc knuckle CX2CX4HX4C containing protein, partial [Tanacetum coccineum]
IDVAATFGVPLTTVGDLHKLINDIEAGKHDELLSEMTNDDRMETMDALGTICNSIHVDNINADVTTALHVDDSINLNVDESTIPSDPIVQYVDINTKSTSYAGAAGASAKDQPKVNSNFRILVTDPAFDVVGISIPRKIVEKVVLEGGPWLIRISSIIPKKWSMDTRLLKEELARIPIWVKLHDVRIQVFEEDGISLIATFIGKYVMLDSYISTMCNESWGRSSFARCLIEVNSEADLVDIVTIGIPSLYVDGFTKETIRVEYELRPPRYDLCKLFGHVHDHCPKKVVIPSIVTTSNVVTPTFAGPSVKQNVRYEPKANTSAPKKGVTNVGNTSQSSSMLKTTGKSSKKDNISMSNSFSALNDEEDDENIADDYWNSGRLQQGELWGDYHVKPHSEEDYEYIKEEYDSKKLELEHFSKLTVLNGKELRVNSSADIPPLEPLNVFDTNILYVLYGADALHAVGPVTKLKRNISNGTCREAHVNLKTSFDDKQQKIESTKTNKNKRGLQKRNGCNKNTIIIVEDSEDEKISDDDNSPQRIKSGTSNNNYMEKGRNNVYVIDDEDDQG